LEEARLRIDKGERDAHAVQKLLVERIAAVPGAVLDYTAVVDGISLQPVDRLRGEVLLALAVKFGRTRLIDNVMIQIGD
jgi:pantoate--beta-alanine ligase